MVSAEKIDEWKKAMLEMNRAEEKYKDAMKVLSEAKKKMLKLQEEMGREIVKVPVAQPEGDYPPVTSEGN